MAGNIRNMRVLIYHKSLEVYMQPLEKERLKNTNRQYICQYIEAENLRSILPLPQNFTSQVNDHSVSNSDVQVLDFCVQLIVINVHVDQLLWIKKHSIKLSTLNFVNQNR